MDLRANMATFFRRFAKKRGLSIAKLQIIAAVSRNTLYAYIRGEGNPTLSTLEHLARNLGVDPVAILLGIYDPDSNEFSVLLLNTIRGVSELPQDEQQRFLRQFIREMSRLWDME